LIGNIGTDDSEPFDRVDVYGLATDVRQNNALGRITGLDVILKIVLDDGKDPRTGLNNILNQTIAHIGIFSGVHDQEGHFSCVSLAATYIDNVNDD